MSESFSPPTGPPARPRWVTIAIVVGALILVIAALALLGVIPGGPEGHGPGRHTGMAGSTSVDAGFGEHTV